MSDTYALKTLDSTQNEQLLPESLKKIYVDKSTQTESEIEIQYEKNMKLLTDVINDTNKPEIVQTNSETSSIMTIPPPIVHAAPIIQQKRKTLLLVGYYHLADGFKTCANYLSKDYDVEFFPLLAYNNLKLNIEDGLINCINGKEPKDKVDYPIPCSFRNKIDVVLLWYHSYFSDNANRFLMFESIRKQCHADVKFVGYSWDPILPGDEVSPIKLQLISSLDYYLTGDNAEIIALKNNGLANIHYCPSGFDPKVSYNIKDEHYACDVSIVCSNLYNNTKLFPLEHTRLNRKVLVDLIYKNRDHIKFNIYGPKFLSELYPDCYRGFIPYVNCPRVFANSKINLCIHAVSYNSEGSNLYFSERLPQILGSKGLLYCETEYKHLLKSGENYVLADISDPLTQIKNILNNYDQYQSIIEKGHQLSLDYFTWDAFRMKLSELFNDK